MRERHCSQLSLPIQSGRVGIRTRVIRACAICFMQLSLLRFDTYRTPQLLCCAPIGINKTDMTSGRTPDSVSLRHLSRDITARLTIFEYETQIRSLRQDCNFACANAQSTCLAPGWTFTQPLPSLAMLVGFYPTVSPLSCDALARTAGGIIFCCSCRYLWVAPQTP